MNTGQKTDMDKKGSIGPIIFSVYVVILILATVSELFKLGWFDFPLFK